MKSITILENIIYLLLISICQSSTYILTQELSTNQFTQNDLASWNPSGANLPTVGFSTCSNKRVMGGYNVFIGDQTSPNTIEKAFSGLISHYSIRIRANFYKIDSWPNNTIFFIVDGVSVYTKTFDATNGGSTNLCGNPYPLTDSVNTNFNDVIQPIDITISHSSSTFTLKIISNLIGSSGSWGIRDILITMEACDQSCLTCTSSSSCTSCSIGLTLSGAYCTCTDITLKRQKTVPCTAMPCVACYSGCQPGYYLSTITTYCEPCNTACTTCTSSVNSLATCSACNPVGFVGGVPSATGCLSCFLGCSQCSSTAFNTCSACKYGYFLTTLNTCTTTCPNKFYGQQKLKLCIACSTMECQTCIGNYGATSYCTSCITNYYLLEYTCYSMCPSGTIGYQGLCLSSCPQRTFPDSTNKICLACPAYCLQCNNNLTCFICQTGALLNNLVCILSCPNGTYADTINQLCLTCHTDCSICNGPFTNNCLGCSVLGNFLILGTCYSSCPSFTYPPTCGLCSNSCLRCNGNTSNNCLTCSSLLFLHLNTSSCVLECAKGQISNNEIRTCLTCFNQQVAYFQQCVSCSPTCNQCNGISFIQCTSCISGTQLVLNTCVLSSDKQIIYTPHLKSNSLTSSIVTIMVIHFILSFLIQLWFKNKTNFLYTIELLQILSYTQFLTIQLSQSAQKTAYILYYTNFAAFLTPSIVDYHPKIPTKFLIMKKTGFYIVDALGGHFVMLFCILIFLITKYLSTKTRLFNVLYTKFNPFLIAYAFRLIVLDFFLNVILFMYCFTISNGRGVGSLILLLIDFILLIYSLCWTIKTQKEGAQIALFYNNEIGQKSLNDQTYLQVQEKSNAMQQKIRNNKILPSLVSYLCKFPISITILLFINSSSAQSICYIIYFIFYSLLTVVVPYRRKIYKLTAYFGTAMLFLNALGVVLIARMQVNSYYFQVIVFITLLILTIISFLQLMSNYQFIKTFILYHYYNLTRGPVNENKVNSSHTQLNKTQQNYNKSIQSIEGQLNFEKIDNFQQKMSDKKNRNIMKQHNLSKISKH